MRSAIIALAVLAARGTLAADPTSGETIIPEAARQESAASRDAVDALLRKLILDAIPREYVDERDWGGTKLFTTDLHVHREGLKIETRRKREALNHGRWEMVRVKLKDDKQFAFDLHDVRQDEAGRTAFVIDLAAPLRIHARRANWRRGVQLWSVSADADATLRLRLLCTAKLKLDTGKSPPGVTIVPHVDESKIEMADFRLRGISKIRGEVAEELGRTIQGRIKRQLTAQEEKLASRLNEQIAQNESRWQFSLADAANSPLQIWNTLLKPPNAADQHILAETRDNE